MARNRTIYQSEGVYAGPSPATGVHVSFANGQGNPLYNSTVASQATGTSLIRELLRVQSANYSYNITRTDINQFNQLSAIDRVILEQPTVSMDFSYILYGMSNEKTLGFTISSGSNGVVSAISGILNKTQDERNYFILTAPEGNDSQSYDLIANKTSVVTWGIGNGFISSYTAEGSVGNFPTVSVNIEALNMKVDANYSGVIPAVNPTNGSQIPGWFYFIPTGKQSPDGATINTTDYSISALRPGDITLTLGTAPMGPDWNDIKVQNYSLSFDLSREPLQKLGSKYAFSREISFPVTVNLSVTADIGDVSTGNLANMIDNDANIVYNPTISIVKPGTSSVAAWYQLKSAKLDSMETSSSIGPNKSATFNFSTQLGGPQDLTKGLFMSGMYY